MLCSNFFFLITHTVEAVYIFMASIKYTLVFI